MKNRLLLYCAVTFSITLSCGLDKPKNTDTLTGNYNLIALTSNVSLDLNYDGMSSNDFLNELSFYFDSFRRPSYDLQLTKSLNRSSEWYLTLPLPKDFFRPEMNSIHMRFSIGDYSKSVRLHNNHYNIIHEYSDLFYADSIWLIENKYPYPYTIEFFENNKVEIKVKQKFYDNLNNEWVLTELIAVYEKL